MVNNITAERLAGKIDADEQFTLIDVRPEDSFEAWHVRDAENVSYDPDEGLSEDQLNEVDTLVDGRPVVAICGKGLTSTPFAFELDEHGYDDISVVTGGMEEWSKLYEVVPIETSSDDLVVRQVQRRAKGCLGYVVGSKEVGAVVVDATRQTDQFKVAAQDAGLSIARVLDTHVHADHISGSPTLADEVGVPYHLGDAARERGVEYEYDPLPDGDVIEVGDVGSRRSHARPHLGDDELSRRRRTPVDGRYAVRRLRRADRTPVRRDDASRGAELLYDSLHETILNLPDDTTILPGQVTSPSRATAATRTVLRVNPSKLGSAGISATNSTSSGSTAAFVERLTEDTPEKPPNYETVIAINTGRQRDRRRRK